ncbi:MAG: tRNA uridine-5-carboxymethylaminomethyl(34) synthesis enzyme MnmG [Clostridia bacterium]|nr:tRNA uridine-5-carboxymethylaminomethyl(34) synthesis enzyme MnmG [Clostridia bacterium]
MEYSAGKVDVIVVGAGHAGCEAALAAARMGCQTILFTINMDAVANLPCNPSIGGTGKGHLVREVDALGGEMGKAADANMIQIRMLNRGKGPAVFSLRAQIDRRRYQEHMKQVVEQTPNLLLRQGEIIDLRRTEDGEAWECVTPTGGVYTAKAVVLTTGTYLAGSIIVGEYKQTSGPDGIHAAIGLSDAMRKLGITLFRFKTGTPCRVSRRSVDFSKMEIQEGEDVEPFSYESKGVTNSASCYLTWTNENTHNIIRENIGRSPLYSGKISGIGPRYCPSIEDKVMRFPDRLRHQVFIEPLGMNTEEMYVQGMSSSLPEEVQLQMLRSIEGLENVEVMRTGYAIEYDCIDSLQLRSTLEFKKHKGLFSAGQINGSSGYEEAAAQGIVAGINAALQVQGREPMTVDRSEGYIGVLIDDLVTTGADEPYRIMTSRSEYRLLLRQDNADARLTPKGREAGLISDERWNAFLEKQELIQQEMDRLEAAHLGTGAKFQEFFDERGTARPQNGTTLANLLRRPELTYKDIEVFDKKRPDLPQNVQNEVEIRVKYSGYIKNQQEQVEAFKKNQQIRLPEDMDYINMSGLSKEGATKLDKIRPETLEQANRITGVRPADISVLLIELARRKGQK